MRLKAIDQISISAVQADSLRPGQEFEVSDSLGEDLLKRLGDRVARLKDKSADEMNKGELIDALMKFARSEAEKQDIEVLRDAVRQLTDRETSDDDSVSTGDGSDADADAGSGADQDENKTGKEPDMTDEKNGQKANPAPQNKAKGNAPSNKASTGSEKK